MSPLHQPTIETPYPSTFRERGVAVPFTTPQLAGSRLRGFGRAGIEVVIPSPSGGRGFYVMLWSAVQERFRPSVYDSVLLQRLGGHVPLHPRTVRAAAWSVAREGLAGREARGAAEAVLNADRLECARAQHLLSKSLVAQAEAQGLTHGLTSEMSTTLDSRLRAVLSRLASPFGVTSKHLQDALAGLGSLFGSVGTASDDLTSNLGRSINQLQEARDSIVKSALVSEEKNGIWLGRSVVASMETSLFCARELLVAARALLGDPLKLLKHWIATPAELSALVTRPEWVLDGWERVSLLWATSQNDLARRGTLLEMAQRVPVLPRQVLDWTNDPVPADALDPIYRVTSLSDSWRTGAAAFTQMARNELLQARSL